MDLVAIRPDGLHLQAQASLRQLGQDDTLLAFAAGLIPAALGHLPPASEAASLAEALYDPDPRFYALLDALLVLDAELRAPGADKSRAIPLPAFLEYRPNLPPARFPFDSLRLPPLNHGGRYAIVASAAGDCLAVRLDLHPRLAVAGHVRLVLSGPGRPPLRLRAAEHRLERQRPDPVLVEAAFAADPSVLSRPERAWLVEAIRMVVSQQTL